MILNKKYFVLPLMALLATVFVACNDDDPTEVYVGNMPKYQKAYLTTGVSHPNGTVLKGGITADRLDLTDEGELVLVKGGNMAPSGSFDTDIYFRTTYAVKKAISGTVALMPDAEEFVTRYNTEHQTACILLPEKYYTIENGHATIEAGSKDAVIHVLVDTDLDWGPGEYLLPLGLTLDDGAAIGLSEEMRTLCLKYTIADAPESDYPAEGRILTRDDFDIELISGSPDYQPQNAFDADRSTIWDTTGNISDVVVTFKEPHYVSRICVVDNTYVFYTWMAYEDTPDAYFGGSYTWGEEDGVVEFNPVSKGYDTTRKLKRVRLRNYSGEIADIYFFVYD